MVRFTPKRTVEKGHYGLIFILPFFVVFAIFQLYPMLYSVVLSFTDMAGFSTEMNFIALRNYTALLQNEMFLQTIYNTFLIWIMNFFPQMSLALLLAAWFTRRKNRIAGTGMFKVIFYLPNIITAASVAILFYALFNYPSGPVFLWMVDIGVIPPELNLYLSQTASRMIVSFIQFWMWFGNTTIVLVAAMLGINSEFYEAAEIDGATDREVFWNITIPLIRPMLLYTLVTSCIGGLQIFDIPFLFLDGGPVNSTETMATFIYKQAFEGSRNYGVASAASVLLMLIGIALSVLVFKCLKEEK